MIILHDGKLDMYFGSFVFKVYFLQSVVVYVRIYESHKIQRLSVMFIYY